MKRFELSLLIGLVCSILLSSLGVFGVQAGQIREEVVRLHILANSDSEEDQALKLEVRDAILEGTQEIFLASADRLAAERLVLGQLEEMEAIAAGVIEREGYDYPVSARLVNMYFETRHYGDVTLPAGRYDAVRVEIGEGGGQNWWCVMFPPMCIPAASEHDDTTLEEQIRELGAQPQYKPKFAVVELIESIQNRLDREGEREAEALLQVQEETDAPENARGQQEAT